MQPLAPSVAASLTYGCRSARLPTSRSARPRKRSRRVRANCTWRCGGPPSSTSLQPHVSSLQPHIPVCSPMHPPSSPIHHACSPVYPPRCTTHSLSHSMPWWSCPSARPASSWWQAPPPPDQPACRPNTALRAMGLLPCVLGAVVLRARGLQPRVLGSAPLRAMGLQRKSGSLSRSCPRCRP